MHTEQTPKRLKVIRAAGVTMVVTGIVIVWITINLTPEPKGVAMFGCTLVFAGTIVYGTGRFLSWWHHG